jgi:hypothetical protein
MQPEQWIRISARIMVVLAKPGTRIRSCSNARAGQQCRAAGTGTKILSLISISLVSVSFLLLQPKAVPERTNLVQYAQE